jgi:acetoacetate decarboxylase
MPEHLLESFSMPLGSGAMYPPPPYQYRGTEDLWVTYEADSEAVAELLPPGIEAADDPPVCSARTREVPFSTFGPYNEAYVMVRVKLGDELAYYQPFVLCDNEVAQCAGREIWGYGKKLATFERHVGAEQTIVTVERPAGQRIMTVGFSPEALAGVSERRRLPVLSARFVPSCEEGARPSVAEIVRLEGNSTVHLAADGTPKLWSGRASLTFDAESAADPWHLLRPTRITGGFYGIFDFDLPWGTVALDYLERPDLWPSEPTDSTGGTDAP